MENLNKALQILDEATQPQNIGKISRDGYVSISQALQIFKALIQEAQIEEETSKEEAAPKKVAE